MVLGLSQDFTTFALFFVVLNIAFDLLGKKFLHIDGTDFLFFSPWLAGIKFGIKEGLILAVVILVVHSLFHMRIAKFILLSFPAQILAVVMGYYFGLQGFWVTMVAYYLGSSVITGLLGGLGGHYFMFLLANILTNVAAFFVYQVLV